ncbi:ATP-binding protein [Emcibacter sp. SYSU 3D8]|uniref:sensor histidine kinase n=1 Tax=Emcibacter sp. SYSU 3D8 TaxID=3133969 RepID=UPI0031FEDDC6
MRRIDAFRSTGVRFTLLYVALYLLSTIILLATLYLIEVRTLDQDVREQVDARIEELEDAYRFGGIGQVIDDIEIKGRSHVKLRTFYRLTDGQGNVLAGSLLDVPNSVGDHNMSVVVNTQGVNEQIEIVARTVTVPNGAILTVGVEPVWREAINSLFTRAALGTLAGAVLLGGGIGALMTRRFLSRINDITSTVIDIMGGQLDSRVDARGTHDELDRLAASLNAMLDRIDFLVTETREVTNNVAHDLRTPLSRLSRRLEEARDAGTDTIEGAQALDLAIEESAGILETFNAILSIAQVEGAMSAKTFSPVALSDMLGTLSEAYGPLAEEEGRRFETDIPPGIEVRGDRALILQMLSNLIENAMKHTPEGTPVRLRLERTGGRLRITIEDRGIGIPAESRDRVFDRFVRLEASRTTPGNGLGLSLVAAIAKLHNIRLTLEDAGPGLRVVLTFPKAAPDQAEALVKAPRPVQDSTA